MSSAVVSNIRKCAHVYIVFLNTLNTGKGGDRETERGQRAEREKGDRGLTENTGCSFDFHNGVNSFCVYS